MRPKRATPMADVARDALWCGRNRRLRAFLEARTTCCASGGRCRHSSQRRQVHARTQTDIEFVAPAPVDECVALPLAATCAATPSPAPVTENVAPARPHLPSHMIEYVAPAPAATFAAPAPVTEHVAPPICRHSTNRRRGTRTCCLPCCILPSFFQCLLQTPAPAVTHAAPVPVIKYVTPSPLIE